MLLAAKTGEDRRLFFQWYAGDFTTDAALRGDDVSPERRANPSMASWGDAGYLDEQRRRLPTNKFRRLHLNLPGAPDGAAFSGEHVMTAIVAGRKRLAPEPKVRYCAFVDMSGGSNHSACLAVAHRPPGRIVVDLVISQTGRPPFNPRQAIGKFAGVLKEYRVTAVTGDAFGGQTYRCDFREFGIGYRVVDLPMSDLYEELEPRLNAGEVELPDVGELQEQLLTLVWRGAKIDHMPADHDDFANAAAGVVYVAAKSSIAPFILPPDQIQRIAAMPRDRFSRSGAMTKFSPRQLGYR